MDKSPTESTNLFQRHFGCYQSNPQALELPATPSQQIKLLDSAKLEIADATAHGNVDAAKQIVDFAWAIAAQTNNPEHNALAHWCHAILLSNRNTRSTLAHLDQALLYYREAGRTKEEGHILAGYAHHLNLLGRLDEAEAAISSALNFLRDDPSYRDWPIVYLNAAYIQGQRGEYQAMWDYARQAEITAVAFGHRNPARAGYYEFVGGNAQINQGLAALALSDFTAAEALLTRGMQIAKTHNASELLGRATLNLGRLATYRGQLFVALQWLGQARHAFIDAQIEIDQATVALEESMLYARLMMADRARSAALEAAQAFAKAGIVPESVESYLMATRVSIELEEVKRATRTLDKIRAVVSQAPPVLRYLYEGYSVHPLLVRTKTQQQKSLSLVESARKSLDALGARPEALELALISAHLSTGVRGKTFRTEQASTKYSEIVQRAQKSSLPQIEYQALVALAAHQPAKEACQTLRRAADLIVTLRQEMRPEELKANLLTGYLPLYKELIHAQRNAQQPLVATQTLLEAKGGIWCDLAQPTKATPPSKAWVQARAALTQWQEELRWATEGGDSTSGSPEPAYVLLCQQKISAAEDALTEATRLQSQPRPSLPIPSISEVQQQIAANTSVLEYLVGQEYIEVCILTKVGRPIWLQLGKTEKIQRLLGRFSLLQTTMRNAPKTDNERQQIASAQQPAMDNILRQLYDLLIQPIDSHLAKTTDLILIPDEFLFELPWSALFDGEAYLGQRYSISMLPSSAIIALKPSNAEAVESCEENRSLLLGHAGMPALTNLCAELESVHQVLPESRFINPASSADLAWGHAPSLLHIAAHGHINRRAPLLSSLELADGPFLLADVLTLNLQGTELVTLSACQTGAVPEKGGVLLALAGAFLCAGSKHVLASLWPVDDGATALFMQAFYTHLQEKNQPALALQHAQKTLRDSGYQHPFYWAAFQLLSGFSAL